MKKIVFLVSGNGGNLKFFHQAPKVLGKQLFDLCVIADRECLALEYGRANKLESYRIKYTKTQNFELKELLQGIKPDLIVTNWHKIIDRELVETYRKKMINLHYSLLPSFGGLIGAETILKAFEKGCRFIGATCHFVEEEVDNGKILAQAVLEAKLPVNEAINKVFRVGCLILFNQALGLLNIQLDKNSQSFCSDYMVSPSLTFEPSIFDELFWKNLANL